VTNPSATTPAPPPSAFDTYAEFLKDEIAAQDARKASFEAKGLAVITTSGALVTLLFALAALSTQQAQTFVLPKGAQDWLRLALIAFFAAAVAALITNLPLWYQAPNVDDVKKLFIEDADDPNAALKNVGLARVAVANSAEHANNIKGWVLVAAMVLEVVAVALVALAVNVII
jgi:hypothetical protein